MQCVFNIYLINSDMKIISFLCFIYYVLAQFYTVLMQDH